MLARLTLRWGQSGTDRQFDQLVLHPDCEMRHFLEAVTVCVDYSDFLAETIPTNRPHVDRWIIVTSPDDHETLDLCHHHNLEVISTRDFYRDGDIFNKGRAIERGLGMLSHQAGCFILTPISHCPAIFATA